MKTIAAILGSALLAAACSDKPPVSPADQTETTTTTTYTPESPTAANNAPMPATQSTYSPDQDLTLGANPAYTESETSVDAMSSDSSSSMTPKGIGPTPTPRNGKTATAATPPAATPPAPIPATPAPATHADSAKPDNTKHNARDRHDTLTPGDQGNSKDETRITASIRKQVVGSKMSFNAKNAKIITQGTKVTLRGPVKTDEEKAQIEAFARGTTGVTDVDNQLEVKK